MTNQIERSHGLAGTTIEHTKDAESNWAAAFSAEDLFIVHGQCCLAVQQERRQQTMRRYKHVTEKWRSWLFCG